LKVAERERAGALGVKQGRKGFPTDRAVSDFAVAAARDNVLPMVKGQRVVCINDVFSPTVRALYRQLPVKDNIYTIREVFLGREKIVKGGDTATVGLLLEELVNPKDPFHQGEQELGFTSERFAPLNELPDEKREVEETVAIGAWAPA
jgi:hypothetical protein